MQINWRDGPLDHYDIAQDLHVLVSELEGSWNAYRHGRIGLSTLREDLEWHIDGCILLLDDIDKLYGKR